ncbi:MAG: FAD-binding oxidoreductase [Bacteroidales bacterium]
MEEHTVKILKVNQITHDVKEFITEKPEGYSFRPGQATLVSVNKPGLKEEKRPFTFTSLNDDDHLEFVIKIYSQHEGVTDAIGDLKTGDELIINNPWGAIQYKGPGYFIAGGAGITPFIAIFRDLYRKNEIEHNFLFYSNKTSKDIILEEELSNILGGNVLFTLTREEKEDYYNERIDEQFLKEHVTDFNKPFYVCGTPEMTEQLTQILKKLGASPDSLVFEGT